MPRRPYIRRTAKKPDPIEEDVPLAVEQIAEKEAAPEAASVVSATPSCSMTEKKWNGYPVWQCRKCRVDTLVPEDAAAARKACRR
ncbi:MAG: hypothetical protein EOS58_30790 [Mesorhizobium sp.]|nr:MAG: hypothetical protein EOS58_30790 [Mesorhizobium sp.]